MSDSVDQSAQRLKATAQFQALDYDGNGYIELSDYHQAVDGLLAEFGVDGDAPAALDAREQYVALFDRLRARADTDHDGRVSQEEFLASVTGSVGRSAGRAIRPVAHAVFTVCDQDRDDHLTTEEFHRFVKAIGGAESQADTVLSSFAPDGRISRDAFTELLTQFYADGDPNNPLVHFFG